MVQNVIEDELTNIKYLQDRRTEDFYIQKWKNIYYKMCASFVYK